MAPNRCPREDPLKSVKAKDVFEVKCPDCGTEVEFLGDEKRQKCSKCGEMVANPRLPDE